MSCHSLSFGCVLCEICVICGFVFVLCEICVICGSSSLQPAYELLEGCRSPGWIALLDGVHEPLVGRGRRGQKNGVELLGSHGADVAVRLFRRQVDGERAVSARARGI